MLLHYIRTIPDVIIGELIALVLTSRNIRIRRFEELEDANLEDPIMPNEWIYHKDTNSTESSNYVRTYYDDNRQDEEIDGW